MSIAAASWVSSVGTTAVSTGTGTKEFYVGATLSVGASQLSDTYNGTYDVTVHYE